MKIILKIVKLLSLNIFVCYLLKIINTFKKFETVKKRVRWIDADGEELLLLPRRQKEMLLF